MDLLRCTRVAYALLPFVLAGCSSQPAILLTVSGDQPAQQYQLWIHDDDTETIAYQTGWTPVSMPGQPPLDITKESFKLALKLSRSGHFTMLVVGVIGQVVDGKPSPTSTVMFYGQRLNITGTTSINAQLLTVPPGDDADGDFWPDVNSFRQHVPAAAKLYAGKDTALDCDDKTDNPKTPTGMIVPLKAAQINPFANPICGIGYSVSCDGTIDPCVDKDGDHDVRGHDCDDSDPKRHHPTDIDPYPDPPNCCGYSLGKQGTPDEFTDFLYGRTTHYAATYKPDKMLCPSKRCGDGIDESCRGVANDPKNDTTCIVDEDCDGYPAPPQGNDCDDHDPKVHPGAPEPCGSTKDLNCNGTIGEGCIPCDLDGDGYERKDAVNMCPDKNDKHPGMVDCNDDDAGVFPGATTATGGSEAGVSIGVVAAGLRGFCRPVYESTSGGANTARIAPTAAAGGGLLGDADCNGVAYQGCPALIDPACDKDGDGFPGVATVNGKNCNPDNRQLDCDDTDPTTFPGAPDNCKTAANENCVTPVPDCSQDADGDGYLKGADCNDNDPNIHPWATELCDGVDNDCDGLVDEGNPDPTGKPLVSGGSISSCTDSNTGECGKQLGSCVCSASKPVVDPLLATLAMPRTSCPGESASMRAPGCFGAGQPKPQSCDATNPKDDDCDGRVDATDGVRLAAKGMTCGINVGQCKAGIVTACDMNTGNPNSASQFVSFGRLPLSSAWLVCSSTTMNPPGPQTVYPRAELCNGLDDDCDGVVPGSGLPPPGNNTPGTPPDEFDHDRDTYMACQGCAGLPLAPGIIGCGDCRDNDATYHPGAKEVCDGQDNACAAYNGQTFVDGKDDCATPPKTTCCGGNGCQDTQNMSFSLSGPNFCGSCTPTACSLNLDDRCLNGSCSCGPNGQCGGGKTCQWSTNTCVVGAGSPCMQQADCVSGTYCIEINAQTGFGVCCTSNGCGTCQQCTGPGGTCQPTGQGSDPPNGTCTAPKLCDGNGHCLNGLGQSCLNSQGMSSNALCYNGICADGVCCTSTCMGQCQHCDGTGMCVQTVGAPVINASGVTPTRSACTGSMPCQGSCDSIVGTQACDYPGLSTPCPTSDGQTCTMGSNNNPATIQPMGCKNGGCVNNGSQTNCGNGTIICSGDFCQAKCTADTDCITKDYCNSSAACTASFPNGSSCATEDCLGGGTGCRYCASNNCVSGVQQCCKSGVTTCAAFICVTSTSSAAQSCNVAGSIGNCATVLPVTTCSTGYACNGTTGQCVAPGKCTDDSSCASGYYCNSAGNCTAEATKTACPTDCMVAGCNVCLLNNPCPKSGNCP